MNPESVQIIADAIITIAVFAGLVHYSENRKFKKATPKGLADRLERRWVEIIAAGVLVPQWASWIPHLLEKLVGG